LTGNTGGAADGETGAGGGGSSAVGADIQLVSTGGAGGARFTANSITGAAVTLRWRRRWRLCWWKC
jgi:hypothetical protein